MEGGSLSDRIHRALAPLTAAERVAIAIQITRGLQYLHGTGASTTERVIVHSDLKPENVMLTKRGDAKIADFGLSRTRKNAEKSGGSKGIAGAGTPAYMVLSIPLLSLSFCVYSA
jgi:serine/threonine protein kinase